MTLVVHTARISTRDPDRFDVTRKSGGPEGEVFAPSWDLLKPVLRARRDAEKLLADAHALTHSMAADPEPLAQRADDIERRAWAAYVPAYLEEMRRSYRAHRPAWNALRARKRVVLCCYCAARPGEELRCHRVLLADILGVLGADVRGELR